MIARTIDVLKTNFSAPRFVDFIAPACPPNADDSPELLCCTNTDKINRIEMITWNIIKNVFIFIYCEWLNEVQNLQYQK